MFSSAIKIPILSWCPKIEASALKQAVNISRLPFAFQHVALMPDCHSGYGMPIGGVAALRDVVSPFMVGLDIGCGMHAVKLNIASIDKAILKLILGEIRNQIPVGFNHRQAVDESSMPVTDKELPPICKEQYQSARTQLGTLGGGKHDCLQAKC